MVTPRSEFVRTALRGEWKEATDRTIPLPDDEPAIFRVYQRWLYSGLVCTLESTKDPKIDEEWESLVKAYILGDRLVDPAFQDCIADALVEKLDPSQRFNPQLTNLVFENTTPDCPLLRLWIDIYCQFGRPEWLGHITNVEFLVEFSRLQMTNRISFNAWSKSKMFTACAYHRHGTSPCYRQDRHKTGSNS